MDYVVAYSGGADSTALAILLKEQGHEIELVFADTGAELPETYWQIPRTARALGVQLSVVSNGTYFQWFVNYNFLIPGFQRRWCTRILKQVPQNHFFAGSEIPVAIGIRADEPHRLADSERFKRSGNDYEYCRPLVDEGLDKADVISLCEKHDLLNPCYKWRSNCSCFYCQFQRKNDWMGLLREHSDLYGLTEEWEREANIRAAEMGKKGLSFFNGSPIRQTGFMPTLEQLRQMSEEQLSMFNEPSDDACLICRW